VRNSYEITHHDESGPDGAPRRERITIDDTPRVDLVLLLKVAFWILVPLVLLDTWRKAPIATPIFVLFLVVIALVWRYPRLRRPSSWRIFAKRRGRHR